jgi:hypothetical protein
VGGCTQSFALAKQAYHLSHTSSLFCSGYFGDGVCWTICPGWPWTVILPISASQIPRITVWSTSATFSLKPFPLWMFLSCSPL